MKILVTLFADFPFGTPCASRMLNFCRLFRSLNHDVTVISDYISKEAHLVDCVHGVYENVDIFSSFKKRTFFSKVFKAWCAKRTIRSFLRHNKCDLIVSVSAEDRFKKISKIAQKHKIPLILESCEKYHSSNWRLGKFDPRYWIFLNCWNHNYFKPHAVIAISRLLEKHFNACGYKTIRIPSILDVKNIPYSTRTPKSSVSFVFSGSLGHGKDSLVEFMMALNNVRHKLRRKMILNIYGPSKDAVENQLGEIHYVMQNLGDEVCYHGRIPQSEIPLRLMENDFGIILRPQRESSNAGFPTKLAEYMSAGLAVLANDTGDIGLYLNESNGFLLKNKEVQSVEKALLAIDALTEEDLFKCRKCARDTAEKCFDFRVYAKNVNDFLFLRE